MKADISTKDEALYMVLDDTIDIGKDPMPVESDEEKKVHAEIRARLIEEFDMKPMRSKKRKKNI